jgi:von Willebrand factor type A C-terminal domain
MSGPRFAVEVFQNEYLPVQASEVNAIVTVTCADPVADQVQDAWPTMMTSAALTLLLARELFQTRDDRLGHAILLTDGMNGQWPGSLSVNVEPADAGQEMLAARVSLVASAPSGPQTLGQGLVRAVWTDDEALSTRINRHVAHYTGQSELAQAIRDGLEARSAGDNDTAAARLGHAVALAAESGNQDTARLLAKVVDVIDPVTGTVRLKATVADADEMALDTRSTKTVRVRK